MDLKALRRARRVKLMAQPSKAPHKTQDRGVKRRKEKHVSASPFRFKDFFGFLSAISSPNGLAFFLSSLFRTHHKSLEFLIKVRRLLTLLIDQTFFEPHVVLFAESHFIDLARAFFHATSRRQLHYI